MIQLVVGKKGSGKTKVLLDQVSDRVEKSNGDIVFIDNSDQHAFKLDHKVRLVNVLNYGITSHDHFQGLIAGILAGNYDITDIYVDAILRIVGRDYQELANMFEKINQISKDVNIVFTVSADDSELPENLKQYCK